MKGKQRDHELGFLSQQLRGQPLSDFNPALARRVGDVFEAAVASTNPSISAPDGVSVGDTVTCTAGSYAGGTLVSRRWYRTLIEAGPFLELPGGNTSSFVIPPAALGYLLICKETWQFDYNGDVGLVTLSSNFLGAVTAADISSIPNITAGAGFSGATADPGQHGVVAFGSTFKPAARWTWPPYDEFTTETTLSVYAFHPSGIAKVRFILDDGTPVDVTTETVDPRTGHKGYTVAIDATAMADKQNRELRAIVYPVNGPCRILQGWTVYNEGVAGTSDELVEGEHSLWFATNANGTLPTGVQYVDPVNGNDSNNGLTAGTAKLTAHAASKTLSSNMSGSSGGSSTSDNGGGTIYLMAGDHYIGTYAFPDPRQKYRWLRVTPAPGVTKEQCPVYAHQNYLSSGSGLRANHCKWDGILFKCPVTLADSGHALAGTPLKIPITVSNPFGSGNSKPHMWFHNCTIDWGVNGNSWWEGGSKITDCEITYWTNCVVKNHRNANGGHRIMKLVLNCYYEHTTEAVSGAGCLLGCEFVDIVMPDDIPPETPSEQYPHADIMQVYYTSASARRAENRVFAENEGIVDLDAQGFFINPDTGSTRAREMVLRDNHLKRKTGTNWVMMVFGPLTDAMWSVNNLIEGNQTCSASATVTLSKGDDSTEAGAQLWWYPTGSATADSVPYAAAGSPAFPWTSPNSGLRYES